MDSELTDVEKEGGGEHTRRVRERRKRTMGMGVKRPLKSPLSYLISTLLTRLAFDTVVTGLMMMIASLVVVM